MTSTTTAPAYGHIAVVLAVSDLDATLQALAVDGIPPPEKRPYLPGARTTGSLASSAPPTTTVSS
ncbi:MAG: hypothetical protein QM679_01740 [Patulibacter sp.]